MIDCTSSWFFLAVVWRYFHIRYILCPCREEITEDSLKLEKEKESLKAERSAFIKERSKNDDKESRIGSLITQLDEKESKLRVMMGE